MDDPAVAGASERLRLDDLVSPLSPQAFLDQHWGPGQLFLSDVSAKLVERLKAVAGLASVEALVSRHKSDIRLFGSDSFRAAVSPTVALDFLDRGYNLYITGVEETVAEAKVLLLDVARDLGLVPSQIFLEAFAGRTGGVSSRHYDHDVNFQILLEGEKEWHVEENRHISNPLKPYHPQRGRKGEWIGFEEEAYSADGRMPDAFDPTYSRKIHARAGSVLFLPRAYWHETRSLTDTWSVNLVIKGITWAAALAGALESRLQRDPRFRAFVEGVVYGGRTPTPDEQVRCQQTFETVKAAAVGVLGSLTLEEAALDAMALGGSAYQWEDGTEAREVIEVRGRPALRVPGVLEEPLELGSGVAPIVTRLCAFRQPFGWAHARAVVTGASAAELYNLLAELVEFGLLRVGPVQGR